MLLKLPIILSEILLIFILFSKIIPNLPLQIYANVLQEPQYLTYKTQNIPFIILISHLMYNKSFSTSVVMDTSNI